MDPLAHSGSMGCAGPISKHVVVEAEFVDEPAQLVLLLAAAVDPQTPVGPLPAHPVEGLDQQVVPLDRGEPARPPRPTCRSRPRARCRARARGLGTASTCTPGSRIFLRYAPRVRLRGRGERVEPRVGAAQFRAQGLRVGVEREVLLADRSGPRLVSRARCTLSPGRVPITTSESTFERCVRDTAVGESAVLVVADLPTREDLSRRPVGGVVPLVSRAVRADVDEVARSARVDPCAKTGSSRWRRTETISTSCCSARCSQGCTSSGSSPRFRRRCVSGKRSACVPVSPAHPATCGLDRGLGGMVGLTYHPVPEQLHHR